MAHFVTITYFVHGTTTDNEQGIATGWNQGELSSLGQEQSLKLKELIRGRHFDAVFSSDLKRAADSAQLAFGESGIPIITDARLRECNYGMFNGGPADRVDAMILACVEKPFPLGESYRDVEQRMRSFCDELIRDFAEKHVAVVSHRAPQLALEVIVNGKTWPQAIAEDWRRAGQWKPGWIYVLRG